MIFNTSFVVSTKLTFASTQFIRVSGDMGFNVTSSSTTTGYAVCAYTAQTEASSTTTGYAVCGYTAQTEAAEGTKILKAFYRSSKDPSVEIAIKDPNKFSISYYTNGSAECPTFYTFEFHGTIDLILNECLPPPNYIKIPYHLHILSARLKQIEPLKFFKTDIVLPNYEGYVMTCYVKNNNLSGYNNMIEVHIENKFNMEIEGNETDYKASFPCTSDIDVIINFVFVPSNLLKTEIDVPAKKAENLLSKQNFIKASNFQSILSNKKFADVILWSKDQVEVQSYRHLLACYSPVFAKIFEERKETPVKIEIAEFSNDIISAALDFLSGNQESVKDENVYKLLDFATKYSIKELKDACCFYCNEDVNPMNVCDIIQIAYSHNFEELKEKCKKIMVENKGKIDQEKLKALSKEILFEVYV